MKEISWQLVDGEHTNPLHETVRLPEQVAAVFQSLKDHASETCLAVYLKEDLTGTYDVHSTGTPAMTTLSINDLFGRAYVTRARYIVLVHNHPKGDPTPSPQDRAILAEIKRYADPLPTVTLLDFIIIGEGKYWSWFEEEDGGEYSVGAVALN